MQNEKNSLGSFVQLKIAFETLKFLQNLSPQGWAIFCLSMNMFLHNEKGTFQTFFKLQIKPHQCHSQNFIHFVSKLSSIELSVKNSLPCL